MPDTKNTLAIVTVVYENYDILGDFFKSLENQKDGDFHLYISDLSKNKKEIDTQKFPVTVLPGVNKGYSHGVNAGLNKAVADGLSIFCVINNDTFFKENFVSSVKKSLARHENSLVGGKIYYAPGYEYHKDRYGKNDSGKVLWYAGGSMDWNHAMTPHRGVDEVDNGQYDTDEETGFITGALMCFDKGAFEKLGSWDESYFLYYEDADYCARALRKNVKLFYDPAIVIWHKVSSSTEGSGSSIHQKYQNRNRLKFGLKYAPFKTKLHLLKNSLAGR